MKGRMVRIAIVAAAAAGVFCVLAACVFPVAWSPDSKRVIFSVPPLGDDHVPVSIARLVMTDLEGRPLRDVAQVEPPSEELSPAAWSPDGRWIAYFKFVHAVPGGEEKPESLEDAETIAVSLMLQEAESGEEKSIFEATVPWKDDELWKYNMFLGPQWAGHSKGLLVDAMPGEEPGLLMVDLEGKTLGTMPLAEADSRGTAALSPDGRMLVYVQNIALQEEGVGVYVRDLGSGTARQVGQMPSHAKPAARLGWSSDSRTLYVPWDVETEGTRKCGLQRIDVKSGGGREMWGKQDAELCWLSHSAQTGRLAVQYRFPETGRVGIDVLEPGSEEVVPIAHGESWFGPAISPDGQWVAFGGQTGYEEDFLGVIASADGARLSFFVPDEARRDELVGRFCSMRFEAALAAADAYGPIEQAGPTEGALRAAGEALDRVAKEHPAPIFQEAVAWGRVVLYVNAIRRADPERAKELAAEARRQLEAYRDAYPESPLAAHLEKELEAALGAGDEQRSP